MKNLGRPARVRQRLVLSLGMVLLAVGTVGCNHLFATQREVARPAASEFGFGPRASANRAYIATLESPDPLHLRRLQTVRLVITDEHGRPIDDAAIAVDGGMPEHAHGLPTQPRVSRALGDGRYEIAGLRFSMGGWWELNLAVDSSAGHDRVTFNLDL